MNIPRMGTATRGIVVGSIAILMIAVFGLLGGLGDQPTARAQEAEEQQTETLTEERDGIFSLFDFCSMEPHPLLVALGLDFTRWLCQTTTVTVTVTETVTVTAGGGTTTTTNGGTTTTGTGTTTTATTADGTTTTAESTTTTANGTTTTGENTTTSAGLSASSTENVGLISNPIQAFGCFLFNIGCP